MDTPATPPFPSLHYIFASLTMLCLVTCSSTDCISRDTDFQSQPMKVYDVKLKLSFQHKQLSLPHNGNLLHHYSHFRYLVNDTETTGATLAPETAETEVPAEATFTSTQWQPIASLQSFQMPIESIRHGMITSRVGLTNIATNPHTMLDQVTQITRVGKREKGQRSPDRSGKRKRR